MVLASDSKPLLCEVIPVYEEYLHNLERLMAAKPQYKDAIFPAWELACKYYTWTDETDAYVLCMCTSISLSQCSLLTQCIRSREPQVQVQSHQDYLGSRVSRWRSREDQEEGTVVHLL